MNNKISLLSTITEYATGEENMENALNLLREVVSSNFFCWEAPEFTNIGYRHSDDGNLVILNYTGQAMIDGNWNNYEIICRGLILDAKSSNGTIVARAFDKFFNWGERGRKAKYDDPMIGVYDKTDGSLGIVYYDIYNDMIKVSTRGSLTSPQALWATEHINEYYPVDLLKQVCSSGVTLIVEIIYPENRIVIDYKGKEALILSAARNHNTGEYLNHFEELVPLADKLGFELPRFFNFNNVEDILATTGVIDVNQEGYVLEFKSGKRFKIKGDRYLELHKLISNISLRNVALAIQYGSFDVWLRDLPNEFISQVEEHAEFVNNLWAELESQFETIYNEILEDIPEHVATLPEKQQRKEFALRVQRECKDGNLKLLKPAMFTKYNGDEVWRDVVWGVIHKHIKHFERKNSK